MNRKEILDSQIEDICDCLDHVMYLALLSFSEEDQEYVANAIQREMGPSYVDGVESSDYIEISLDNYRLRRILEKLEAGGYLSAPEGDTKLKSLREEILKELEDEALEDAKTREILSEPQRNT